MLVAIMNLILMSINRASRGETTVLDEYDNRPYSERSLRSEAVEEHLVHG